MKRLLIKVGCYWCIFSIFCLLYQLSSMTAGKILILSITLGLVNTLVRPILLIIVGIFNLFTLGLMSVLVNYFTLWLASLSIAYWWNVTGIKMLILAIVIMLVDDWVARVRCLRIRMLR